MRSIRTIITIIIFMMIFTISCQLLFSSDIDYFNEGLAHYNMAESAMENKNYLMAFQEYGKAAEMFNKGGYNEMRDLSIDKSAEVGRLINQSSGAQKSNNDNESAQINSGVVVIGVIFLILLYALSKGKPQKKQGPRSIQGDNHRSNAETRISNWFYRNGIKHYYESQIISKRFWEDGKSRYYVPDFYLPKFGLFVEYWGLAGDDFYDNHTLEKQQYYDKRKIKLINLYPPDLKNIEQAFKREFRNNMGYEYPHRIKYSDLFDIPENK